MTAKPKVQALAAGCTPAGDTVALVATITCPHCGHRRSETMPTDACQFLYDCQSCGAVLRPKPGDCCVFCSYADLPCPPIQAGGREAGAACCR